MKKVSKLCFAGLIFCSVVFADDIDFHKIESINCKINNKVSLTYGIPMKSSFAQKIINGIINNYKTMKQSSYQFTLENLAVEYISQIKSGENLLIFYGGDKPENIKYSGYPLKEINKFYKLDKLFFSVEFPYDKYEKNVERNILFLSKDENDKWEGFYREQYNVDYDVILYDFTIRDLIINDQFIPEKTYSDLSANDTLKLINTLKINNDRLQFMIDSLEANHLFVYKKEMNYKIYSEIEALKNKLIQNYTIRTSRKVNYVNTDYECSSLDVKVKKILP
ncbi:hypothetical protein AGMMS49938_02610 [Fibrobacterales bacterium]|nr:hypothetical protein AGMMS49938_02610 [Fibrobacterales bacterium]